MLQFFHALLLLQLDLVIPVGLTLRRTAVTETQDALKQKDNTIDRYLDSFGETLNIAYRERMNARFWDAIEGDMSDLIIDSPVGEQMRLYENLGWACDSNRVYLDCESEELAELILREWRFYRTDTTKLEELMVKDGGKNERWVRRWMAYEKWLSEMDR